jgi:glycosyltransferase involved in cell wall biosynthesis
MKLPKHPKCTFIFYNNPDTYPPIVNAARLFARNGWRLQLICRDNGERWGVEYPNEVQLDRFGSGQRGSWRQYLHFARHCIAATDPDTDVIIGHDMHGLLPAYLAGARFRAPVIYHCHDFAADDQKLPMGATTVRWAERRIARHVEAVVVPDRERAQVVFDQLNLQKQPLVVANAPLRTYQPRTERLTSSLRSKFPNFTKVVLRQGRIGYGHAIEATIRSLQFWDDRNALFVLIGPGDHRYLESLFALAQRERVQNRFHILPAVSYDTIFEFTVGATVGHALYEPIHINNEWITTASNKLMEYMSAGIPVLVSKTPSMTSFIDRHQCGVAAREQDPRDIAAAVNRLLEDQSLVASLGAHGREAFEAIYCYDQQYGPVIDYLEAVIHSGRRPPH